jgi:hypothetical protein
MPKQRDGPAPQETTPGQGQKGNERARLLPQAKTPRNPQGRSPSSHHRKRHRQPQGWREFNVRVFTKPDAEGVHAMHVYLRTMARRYGLTIAEIDEVRDHEKDR